MIPETLAAAVKDRTIVPFVGTGLSVSVGRRVFPDWSGLIDRLADRLVREGLPADAADVRAHTAAKRFPEAAELAFEKLTPGRFGEEMRAAFHIPVPRDANLSAVEALWRLRPPTVITTNYDAVLQWPFMGRGDRPYPTARTAPSLVHNDDPSLLKRISTSVAGNDPLIWHLHGSVERPDTIILTQRQYERLYGAGSVQYKLYAFALDQLRSLVANRTLLFVGFSLEDPFVSAQLEYIFEQTSKQNPVSFILLRKGQKDATAMLARYHVQIVEFEDFGPPMVRAIGEIADEVWGPGAASVSVPRALVGLVDDLRALLRGIAPEPAIVGRAFNRWRPQGWATFPLGGDGVALALAGAEKLADAMRQSGGYYPLVEFVRELGTHSRAGTGKVLAPWLTAATASLGADLADSTALAAGGFISPNDGGDGDYYVLIRLDESGSDSWRGQAWLFGAHEPWKLFQDEQEWARGDFPSLVSDLLDRIAALELPPERTTVAFMVPRALLVEAIDQLEPAVEFLREAPIGVTLPVTVRSLERLKFPRNMRRLCMTWQALKSVQASAWTLDDVVPPHTLSGAVWLNAADAGPDLVERLQKHGVMCAVLAAPPTSKAADAATDLFNCVLQAAVPAVVWLRQPAADDMLAARSQMEKLLGEATPSLPQRVWQLRQAARALADPAHPGQCLVLLWDDADRLPPDQDPNNRAVVLRA